MLDETRNAPENPEEVFEPSVAETPEKEAADSEESPVEELVSAAEDASDAKSVSGEEPSSDETPVLDEAPVSYEEQASDEEPAVEVPTVESDPVPVEKPPKKKRGYVRYSPFALILLSVCAFVFSFSMFGLLEQNLLDAAGESEKDNLSQIAFPGGNNSGNDGSFVPGTTPDVNKWQEISPWSINPDALPFLSTVNFGALKTENPDTVGWLHIPSTADVKGLPINLPMVQSTDNEYYLTRSFDRTFSSNGWVYLDYRNNMADLRSNRNLIIYGHARSYLIFGGLKYLNQQTQWQQDGYNQFLYVNTPTERTVWQIFSWYETTVDFNYISTYFADDAEYVNFLRTLQEKNQIPVFEQFNFTAADRILTLSTCKGTDENVRVAVHAVLVRHEMLNTPSGGTVTTQPGTETGTGDVSDSAGPSDTGNVTDSGVASDAGNVTDSGVVSNTGNVTDSGVVSNTGSVSDSGSVPSVMPPVTDLPSNSGSVAPPVSNSSGNDAPSGSTDGGTPSDTSQSDQAGTSASQKPPSGTVTDGGSPSETDMSPSSSTDSSGGQGGVTDAGSPPETESSKD